jgi:flagellin-specific chaperone FliS
MNENYIMLLDLGLSFLGTFLRNLKNKLPTEAVSAIQAAFNAIYAHRADEITKANLEAQRG